MGPGKAPGLRQPVPRGGVPRPAGHTWPGTGGLGVLQAGSGQDCRRDVPGWRPPAGSRQGKGFRQGCVLGELKDLLRTPAQAHLHTWLHGGRTRCLKTSIFRDGSQAHRPCARERVPAVSKTDALQVSLTRQPDTAAVSVAHRTCRSTSHPGRTTPQQKDPADFKCYGEVRYGFC